MRELIPKEIALIHLLHVFLSLLSVLVHQLLMIHLVLNLIIVLMSVARDVID